MPMGVVGGGGGGGIYQLLLGLRTTTVHAVIVVNRQFVLPCKLPTLCVPTSEVVTRANLPGAGCME
jgi:hypothetical protein